MKKSEASQFMPILADWWIEFNPDWPRGHLRRIQIRAVCEHGLRVKLLSSCLFQDGRVSLHAILVTSL